MVDNWDPFPIILILLDGMFSAFAKGPSRQRGRSAMDREGQFWYLRLLRLLLPFLSGLATAYPFLKLWLRL